MTLKLLIVMIAVCLLAGCVRFARDDVPASDLIALETSVSRDLQPRLLDNVKDYCAELATTEKAQYECLGDLEDLVFLSNRDKARALATLHKGLERLELARNPCRLLDLACHRRKAALAKP
jgi:hypothetical protein